MQKYCEKVVFGEIRKSLEFRKHCGVAREWHCQSYLPELSFFFIDAAACYNVVDITYADT
jgi:hypothetical protein